MENRKSVIEKIKKIMALAENNPNENEAMAAALKAQKLMAEYSIEESDLGTKITEDNIDSIMCRCSGKPQKWRYQLAVVLAKNFRCNIYLVGDSIAFYGYEQDREICAEVFYSLYTIGVKLSDRKKREYRKKYGTATGVRNTFCLGFVDGIKNALEKQCTALMIVVPKEVNDKFNDRTKNYGKRTTSLRCNCYDKRVYDEGFMEGKSAIGQRGIEGVG